MITETVTTDSAGIGAQGGYNGGDAAYAPGDARLPFVLGTFKRFYHDEWTKKKKKRGKQKQSKGKRVRKRSGEPSFGSI